MFFVENGIGFGHIQRSLLIAESIAALSQDVEIYFISQATSLLLFKDRPFKVINFPFLHRLPDNSTEAFYKDLLNSILVQINPTLIIEDTDPSWWCYGLPAVQNVPKMLMLRRVPPLVFDNFRRSGDFARYDKVLLIQEEQELARNNYTWQSKFLVDYADLFKLVGPVFRTANQEECRDKKRKYASSGAPLVVVTVGAGGEHSTENTCEQLFLTMSEVADSFLQSGEEINFIFVLGPYYRGKKIQAAQNVTVVDYEQNLTALLQVADVVVMRPGFNSMYETLNGNAHIITIPSISYRENQKEWIVYLQERYGIDCASTSRKDEIRSMIEVALDNSERLKASPPRVISQATVAAEEIIKLSENDFAINFARQSQNGVFLVIEENSILDRESFVKKAESLGVPLWLVSSSALDFGVNSIRTLDRLGTDNNCSKDMKMAIFLDGKKAQGLKPTDLSDQGVIVLFYTAESSLGGSAEDWCAAYKPANYGVIPFKLDVVSVSKDLKDFKYFMHRKFIATKDKESGLYLDFSACLDDTLQLEAFERIIELLKSLRIEFLTKKSFCNRLASSLLVTKNSDSGQGLEIDKVE